MARLVLLIDGERVLEHRLRDGRTVIGRSDACDFTVPGDSISRTHCVLQARNGVWQLIDRSRHGVVVNDEPVDGQRELGDGDRIDLGSAVLLFEATGERAGPTASVAQTRPPAEELVASERGLTVMVARLTVREGPAAGAEVDLTRPKQTLGGPGSDVVLDDPSLEPHHLSLHVARGRVSVAPGTGAVFVDGARARGVLPVYPGELVTAGATVFSVGSEFVERDEARPRFGEMVADSLVMRGTFGILARMAAHTAPVLLVGESGTGKELAARALHDEGNRAGGPFVPVNCGGIPETLFESELFGHEKGAFTGATTKQDGAFQRAAGGTLFLDEVGELPLEAQAKLLRALETGEVRRVGGARVTYPDVRIVAATNRDLEEAVAEGGFRQDLYFRLAVLAVRLPPLRERPEDLAVISEAIAAKLGGGVRVMPDAVEVLKMHDWPGNVRELRNVLTRAFVLNGPLVTRESVQFSPWSFPAGVVDQRSSANVLAAAEKEQLRQALAKHQGNRSAIARELGVARSTLIYKLQRHGLI